MFQSIQKMKSGAEGDRESQEARREGKKEGRKWKELKNGETMPGTE